jgi:hypothetical protein
LKEPLAGMQIVTHDSQKYGAFRTTDRFEELSMRNLHLESVLSAEAIPGKAVIYMWHAEEDGNHYHYILLAIVHSVIGGPSRSSRLSQLSGSLISIESSERPEP